MGAKLDFGLRLVILSVLLIGLQFGCGIKDPPVPPPRYRPPAVTDLSYQLDGQALTLSWSVPETRDGDAADPVGCFVYMANQPLVNTDCPNCSEPFSPVADLQIQKDASGKILKRTMTYTGVLTQGFIYTYKIACYAPDGGLGADSNVVNVSY
ncbi:MAG: hypothetical protein PVJ00_03245 [Desulfobacterales bacterium]|jgi:hypothetical protein